MLKFELYFCLSKSRPSLCSLLVSKVQIGALWPSPKVDKKSRKNAFFRQEICGHRDRRWEVVCFFGFFDFFFFALKLPVYRLKDAGLDSWELVASLTESRDLTSKNMTQQQPAKKWADIADKLPKYYLITGPTTSRSNFALFFQWGSPPNLTDSIGGFDYCLYPISAQSSNVYSAQCTEFSLVLG